MFAVPAFTVISAARARRSCPALRSIWATRNVRSTVAAKFAACVPTLSASMAPNGGNRSRMIWRLARTAGL